MKTKIITVLFAAALLAPPVAHAQFVGDALAAAGVNMSEAQFAEALAAGGYVNATPAVQEDVPVVRDFPRPDELGKQPAFTKVPAPPPATQQQAPPPASAPAPDPSTWSDLGQPQGTSAGIAGASAHAATIDPKASAAWQSAFRPVGSTLTALPSGAVTVEAGGASYSYAMGMFLRQKGSGWEVVAAPPGAAIAQKPVGASTVTAGGRPYTYYGGSFFVYDGARKAWVVTAPPSGATVTYLPDSAKKIQKDGSVFYEYAGTLYTPVYRGSTLAYTVV